MKRAPSDIFVSYADSDIARVKPLIHLLQKQGWSVWWDRSILPGESWEEVIESALDEAGCVVVVWSLSSTVSNWVKSEAEEARMRGVLIPILLDEVKIPLPFRHLQAANLVGWPGDLEDVRLDGLRDAIRKLLASRPGHMTPVNAQRSSPETPADFGSSSTAHRSAGPPSWVLEDLKSPDPRLPFLLPIEDVFSISGRGTVVTGRIERGKIKVGEEVEIVGFRQPRRTMIAGIEVFKKLLDEGIAGDNVGLLLRGVGKDELERGMVLAKPGSIVSAAKFKAKVYMLTKEEGGRHTPFFNGYRAQFYFRITDVDGVAELPAGIASVKPGDDIDLVIKLSAPIAVENGLRFAIREGGNTVGAGMISQLLV